MTNNPTIDGVSRCKTCRGSRCIDNLRSVGAPAAKCPDCTPAPVVEPTIDGVSRELLERAILAIRNTSQMHPTLEDLRALLDALVVERQPVYQSSWTGDGGGRWIDVDKDNFEHFSKRQNYVTRVLYTAPPEVAALQSTIARLEARVAELESGRADTAEAERDKYKLAAADIEWMMEDRDRLNEKLAAAEQRIADLKSVLERMLEDDDMPVHWFAQRIDAALNPNPEAAPDGWVPCSPGWIEAGGHCATAKRWSSKVWDGHSHWHPNPEVESNAD